MWGIVAFAVFTAPAIGGMLAHFAATVPGGQRTLAVIVAAGLVVMLGAVFGSRSTLNHRPEEARPVYNCSRVAAEVVAPRAGMNPSPAATPPHCPSLPQSAPRARG